MPRGLATRVQTALGWAVIAPAALLARTAAAEPGVEWRAPAECPSAAQAATEIDKLRAPGTSAAAQAHVEIRRESALSLQARVAVRAQGQAREHVLRDADCTALTRAAALVVAMAAEPKDLAREQGKGKPQPTAAEADASSTPPTASGTTQPTAAGAPGTQPRAGKTGADARNRASAGEGGSEGDPVPPLAAPRQPDPSNVPEAGAKVTAAAAPSSAQERVVLPVPLPDRRSASPGPRVTLTMQPTEAERRDRGEPGSTKDANEGARRIRGFVSAAVGASTGIVPNLAPSALMSAGVLTRELRAAVRLGYLPRQHAWLDAAAGTGGHVALTSAAAEGGYRLHLSALEVPLFGGIEGGLFSADANGVEEHSARREAWLAAFAGSGLGVTWEKRLGVALRVEGVVALRRPSFALASADGAQRLVFHQPSALGARVYLSLELQFL